MAVRLYGVCMCTFFVCDPISRLLLYQPAIVAAAAAAAAAAIESIT